MLDVVREIGYNQGNFKTAATGVTSTHHSLTMLHVGGVTMATADSTSEPRQLSFADGVEIPLTQGKVAIVDPVDADLAQFKWCARVEKNINVSYAVRRQPKIKKTVILRMHRIILGRMIGRELLSSEEVDHIDLDGLNNRRSNLRLATHAQNQSNQGISRNNNSGYKGVGWSKAAQKWVARITANGNRKHLGTFDTPEAAHAAYCKAAEELHGKFRRTE